ncbi:MAG: HupE/UreJ family protein [Rhodospirillales bacterium]
MRMIGKPSFVLALLAAAMATGPAMAHETAGIIGGFASGFSHPLAGPDHVAAMVAVGLLGAFLGAPALYLLPLLFPLVMAIGGALGFAGVPLPGVELAIAASALILGLMVAAGRRMPLSVAGVVVAFFAVFHGHAHGTELPAAADAFAYALCFVIGTSLLHLVGIGVGLAGRWQAGRVAVRALGGAIAVAGVAFLTGLA